MNLLCPNCQKPLSVPDQYAGQPMRCPLCAGTFTVPAMPQMSAPPPPPAAAPPPPPPPPKPQFSPPPPPDVYGVHDAPPPPPPGMDHHDLDVPMLPASMPGGMPPPPPHYGGPPPTYAEEHPTYPATPMPEGYQRRVTTWFSPKYLQYVAPVAVILIFVLSFFAWTGLYPGGVADVTQNAWQAAFGTYSVDTDIGDPFNPKKDELGGGIPLPSGDSKPAVPGFNFLLWFYLFVLIVTLVVTAACLALSFVPPTSLPPALYPILPWRWGVVAVLNLILLLFFLTPQIVIGFSLENNFLSAADSSLNKAEKEASGTLTTPQARAFAIERGVIHQQVSRTIWLDLVVLFHLLAIIGAGLTFWVNRRGAKPAPRLDLLM